MGEASEVQHQLERGILPKVLPSLLPALFSLPSPLCQLHTPSLATLQGVHVRCM